MTSMTNSNSSDVRDKLEAELKAAQDEVKRLQQERIRRKGDGDAGVSQEERAERKTLSAELNRARARQEQAELVLARFVKSGQEHAVVAQGDRVAGSIAVVIPPGTSHEQRVTIIEDVLGDLLNAAADELGVVVSATPSRYVRERSGRDADGRTVLDVDGVVEGDLLVPAVRGGRKKGRR